jgi:hypothetical protein
MCGSGKKGARPRLKVMINKIIDDIHDIGGYGFHFKI